MDVVGDLTISGSFDVEYDGILNTIDRLDVTGMLTLTGDITFLEWNATGDLDDASPYVFASYGSLSGVPGFTAPAGYTVDFNYNDANQIALVPVPELGSFSLALVGLAGLALLRKRRAGKQHPVE
jgi:hypothetical protein